MENLNLHIHSALIEECREGNSKAQFSLYYQYSRAMYNLAYRMLNNREDAEDMLQETFTECFQKLDTFRFDSTFGAWLKRILINKCINQIKKRKPLLTFTDELPADVYEEENEATFNTEIIFRGIGMLPDGYRIILTLYLLEGYDHSEIGQILGISESTSKSQYSRAKNKLRNIISKLK
ncbi:MAG TPA: RNA polymerase sigma factor [Bacteroidales bacterium]|nr:RNA polymerase sigma factor [Bacteroidales bacterium]